MEKELHRMPGFSCPSCGGFIPTSISQILFSTNVYCPTCGLKINMDKKHSKEVLEKIKKLEEYGKSKQEEQS